MNEIAKLIRDLKYEGIGLAVQGEDLEVSVFKENIDQKVFEIIRENKAGIKEYIRSLDFGFTHSEIPPAPSAPSYPISSSQRRLWVLSQFDGGEQAYQLAGNVRLSEGMTIDLFKKAIDATLERHEILRTVFKEDENGEVRQWILSKEELDFRIGHLDLRSEENAEEKAHAYMSEDSNTPFDLVNGPLLRAALLQVKDQEYIFYYNMHHIISDGWSMEVMTNDVLSYYKAYLQNKTRQEIAQALKPLRIQYKDYSCWQLAQMEDESFKVHGAYWLESLKGDLPVIDLPGMKRPAIKTYRGRRSGTFIGKATTQKLREYSQANGGSLFMSLLSAWNILMYRYTAQEDLIIGSPVSGREHADLEDQIGFYVNTVALRNQVNPAESFTMFYKRVKNNTLKSLSHQVYPFDRLVEDLQLKRDTSRSAVFDVMLVFHNTKNKLDPAAALDQKELYSIRDLGNNASKFDIEVLLRETGDYLSLDLVYNTDVYTKELVEKLMQHYRQLLEALMADPEVPVSQVDFLDEKEKQALLATFNCTAADYPKEKTVMDLFFEQVEKTPDHTAVICKDRELSYKQLDELSDQLAHYLVETCATSPGDRIGIKQQRSEWLIVSVLAVLKSGGVYVPVNPEDPQHRIDFIEKDTQYKVCLDEEALRKFIESQADHSETKVASMVRPGDLAYILYTSGSTGTPKGVMVEHGSLVNYLTWARSTYSHQSRVELHFSLFTPLSFDLTVTSIYLPLISGSTLRIADPDLDLSSVLVNYFQGGISCIKITPAHISLLKYLGIERTTLQVAVVGGDKLEKQHVDILRELNPGIKIYNEYGPTESTVGCMVKLIEQGEPSSLIGKPIANTQIYLLSDQLQLVPMGVTGEICIGGEGLARGYLNQQEITREKFIDNPFKSGTRLYRTGDLGRWLPDGTMEYIGRKDNQVKIRGHRVEPGEIENALLTHAGIGEAVVLVKEDPNGEKELVAYFTSSTEQSAAFLKSYLQNRLPQPLLPAYYIQLDSFPLSANGKIDRKAFPDPRGLALENITDYVAPGNETEQKLIGFLAQVLATPEHNIGIHNNFFDLGMNSMKLIRFLGLINREFKSRLKTVLLFEHSTVYALATYLCETSGKNSGEKEMLYENDISNAMDEMIDLM